MLVLAQLAPGTVSGLVAVGVLAYPTLALLPARCPLPCAAPPQHVPSRGPQGAAEQGMAGAGVLLSASK